MVGARYIVEGIIQYQWEYRKYVAGMEKDLPLLAFQYQRSPRYRVNKTKMER